VKYVVLTVSGKNHTMRFPIIFPNNLVHDHVAKAVGLLLNLMFPRYNVNVTSAGEVNSMDFGGKAYGKSESCRVSSKKTDTQLIRMNDYGAGAMDE